MTETEFEKAAPLVSQIAQKRKALAMLDAIRESDDPHININGGGTIYLSKDQMDAIMQNIRGWKKGELETLLQQLHEI